MKLLYLNEEKKYEYKWWNIYLKYKKIIIMIQVKEKRRNNKIILIYDLKFKIRNFSK